MVDVVKGQVWRDRRGAACYCILNTTPRMAVMHNCDAMGRRMAGFTLHIRQSRLRKDYELLPVRDSENG